MNPFPHHYRVAACGTETGDITLSAAELPTISSAAPKAFGGPGDRWSPEDLLVAAVADCFILSFRAVSRAARLSWRDLDVEATGVLDRVNGVTRFTGINLEVVLRLPSDASSDVAEKALQKAESACLISNSMGFPVHLVADVRIGTA